MLRIFDEKLNGFLSVVILPILMFLMACRITSLLSFVGSIFFLLSLHSILKLYEKFEGNFGCQKLSFFPLSDFVKSSFNGLSFTVANVASLDFEKPFI